MKILPINTRFETQAKIKFDNQTKNQTEVGSRVNKRNFNYGYNDIAFGSNLQPLEKMGKLTASKNYKFEDLHKLFKEMDSKAQEHVQGMINRFGNEGLTLENYLPACVKQSNLFRYNSETVEKNVRGLVEKFKNEGLDMNTYIQSCIAQPSLFCSKPETIEGNVRNVVKSFSNEGLNARDYFTIKH